jgi:hypothetical protein
MNSPYEAAKKKNPKKQGNLGLGVTRTGEEIVHHNSQRAKHLQVMAKQGWKGDQIRKGDRSVLPLSQCVFVARLSQCWVEVGLRASILVGSLTISAHSCTYSASFTSGR